MSNKEIRKVPKKNYVILAIVFIVTILLVYYLYMWYDAYRENKLNKAILDKYMLVINYNELDNYLIENPDTIVYVSVLENQEVREFEKKLKSKLKNKLIEQNVLYMDITDYLDNEEIMNEMNKKYSINEVPLLLVIDNGILKSIYNVSEKGYDIDDFVFYLNSIRLEDEEEIYG